MHISHPYSPSRFKSPSTFAFSCALLPILILGLVSHLHPLLDSFTNFPSLFYKTCSHLCDPVTHIPSTSLADLFRKNCLSFSLKREDSHSPHSALQSGCGIRLQITAPLFLFFEKSSVSNLSMILLAVITPNSHFSIICLYHFTVVILARTANLGYNSFSAYELNV